MTWSFLKELINLFLIFFIKNMSKEIGNIKNEIVFHLQNERDQYPWN
jgi:hypothetical protein